MGASVTLFSLVFAVAVAQAGKTIETTWGGEGEIGGRFYEPADVAIRHSTGQIYVVDGGNNRIQRLDSEGNFELAWGRGVVAPGGVGDKGGPNAVQTVTVKGEGTFVAGFRTSSGMPIEETPPVAHDASAAAFQAALEALPAIAPGDVVVAGPDGGPWTVEYTGAHAGTRVNGLFSRQSEGVTVSMPNPSAAGVFEICTVAAECRAGDTGGLGGHLTSPSGIAIDQASGDVYVLESGRVSQFEADGDFVRAFGWDVVQPGSAGNLPGNERQVVTISGAKGGTFQIQWTAPSDVGATTPDIPYNATAAQVQAALEGLPTISPGDVAVSGPAGSPWTVEFGGLYADMDLRPLLGVTEQGRAAYPNLSPEEFENVSFDTVVDGGTFEVCDVAAECKDATLGGVRSGRKLRQGKLVNAGGSPAAAAAGQLVSDGGSGALAIHPATGDLFIASGMRANQYEADGSFVRAFGWGVDTGADQFEVCTAASGCQHARLPDTDSGAADPFPAEGQLTDPEVDLAIDGAGFLYAAASYRPAQGDTGQNPENGKPFVYRFDTTKALPSEILLPDSITDNGPIGRCTYCTPGPLPLSDEGAFPGSAGIELDPATGHLLYLEGSGRGIFELDPESSPPTLVDTHLPDSGTLFAGLGINGTGEALYASIKRTRKGALADHRIVVVGSTAPAAAMVSIEPPDLVPGSATLKGEITPNGPTGVETSYRFEYSRDGATWTRAPIPDKAIGDGFSPVSVSEVVSGLEANSDYRVRLIATRTFGLGSKVSEEIVFTTPAIPPTVQTRSPQSVGPDSAGLVATVNPNNSPTTYYFEYGESTSYGSRIPIPSESLNGGKELVVREDIDGLKPNTSYHYRVVADNGVEEAPGDTAVEGEDIAFTTRSDFGDPPKRAFELVTPPFKVVRAPVRTELPDGYNANLAVPSLTGDTVVWVVPFFPLTEEVKWPDEGDKRLIRRTSDGWTHETLNSARLQPQSSALLLSQTSIGSSGDLETQGWRTFGGVTDDDTGGLLPTEGPLANRMYTRRTGTGIAGFTPWLTNPSQQLRGDIINDFAVFNDDGSAMARWGPYAGLAEDTATPQDDDPSDDQEVSRSVIYVQRAPDPNLMPAAPKDLANECTGTVATGDATRIPLRDSNGTAASADDLLSSSPCEEGLLTQRRGAVVGRRETAATALADDGARVFFTSPNAASPMAGCETASGPSQENGNGTNCPPQLFVRQYRADGSAVVRWISRSRSVAGPEDTYSGAQIPSQPIAMIGGGAEFEGASRDGRYVFFKTNAPLVPSDPNSGNTNAASNGSWDLYRYELPASHEVDPDEGSLLRISGGPGGSADPNTTPSFAGGGALRFFSDDGQRVYFVTGAPIPGTDATAPKGASTVPGGTSTDPAARNLYLFDATQSGADRYRFVARLPFSPDDPSGIGQAGLNACASFGSGPGGGLLTREDSDDVVSVRPDRSCFRGTADGRHVLFFSGAQLTGDDTDEAGDIYLYDADADELTRVTAPPNGAQPYACSETISGLVHATCNGDLGFSVTGFHADAYGGVDRGRGWGGFRYSNIYRNADGTVSVIFESRSQLVAEDTNGDHWDVYEWRNGELSLISRGKPGHHSYYSGNGKDGRDVFIWTTDRIDPRELDDGSFDVYDARIGGGFPYTAPPEPCDVLGFECEGGAVGPPSEPAGGADLFNGPGNVTTKPKPKSCRKGKVRRKGRCVRPKARAGNRKGAKHKRKAGRAGKGGSR